MWDLIGRTFEGKYAQLIVAKKMLELGISVKDGEPFCDIFRIQKQEIARQLGINRKVVSRVLDEIANNPQLTEVFEKLRPICDISEVAMISGFPVLEIFVDNSFASGIVAKVTEILAREQVSLRFIAALDPEISVESKLILVAEQELPIGVVDNLRKLPGIRNIKF